MDLICFISNAFVDLLSDVANNVCTQSGKKNIIPEHLIKALQELHLDDYLPFLLHDDQAKTIQEVLRAEKKRPDGLHCTLKQAVNEDMNPNYRHHMLNGMLKRLNDGQVSGEGKRKKKKNSSRMWMMGKTPEEIQEIQRRLLENVGMSDQDESFEAATSNESPSAVNKDSSNDNTSPMITSDVQQSEQD